MMIRSNLIRKETKVRVTVAFFYVAEDLIISAVLLDDVDAVFDRARLTYFPGNRVPIGRLGGYALVGPQRAAPVGLLAIGGHPRWRWQIDNAQGPVQDGSYVPPVRRGEVGLLI